MGTAPDVTVTLAPAATGSAEPQTLAISRAAAQVGLRLTGEMGELEHLTAEVAPANAPDDVRRWRVDAAPPAADAAPAIVTLPAYALPTGDYILTLWEGDARVVARFAFRSRKE